MPRELAALPKDMLYINKMTNSMVCDIYRTTESSLLSFHIINLFYSFGE